MTLPESDRNRKCRVGLRLAATLLACALAPILSGLASPSSADAQASRKPLSKEDVVRLLKGDVPPKRVGEMARERGIDFEVTPAVESELRKAGASNDLLGALRGLAPKPAAPPSSPPAPATATLVIENAPAGAQVYIDDEPVGKTSAQGRLKISTLAPGEHRVRLSAEGYREREERFTLRAGETKSFSTKLVNSADSAKEHVNLAESLRIKHDLDGAIREYREAVRLNPDYAEAHFFLGLALANNGDLDGAMVEYREAVRLRPDYSGAHYNLGGALTKKGDMDGAIAEYREAIRLNPDFAEGHFNLGAALVSKGDWDGAIAEYREAIRLKPDFADAHYYLGLALDAKGDRKAAREEYRKAHDLNPKY